GVDSLGTGLQRLRHGLTGDHTGSDFFDHVSELCVDGALAIDGSAQCVDYASTQLGANRHFQNATGRLDGVAFGYTSVITQNHGADRVALEVQSEAENVVGKLEHFALHHVGQTVDAANTVSHGNDRALRADVGRSARAFSSSLISDGLSCMFRLLNPVIWLRQAASVSRMRANWACTEVSSTWSPTTTRTPPIRSGSTVTAGLSLRPNFLSSPAISCWS